MNTPSIIVTHRFLIYGNYAPENSAYKGKIETDSIFGDKGLFEYVLREDAIIDNDSVFGEESFYEYTNRLNANLTNVDSNGIIKFERREDEAVMTNKGIFNKEEKNIYKSEVKEYFKNKGDILWDLVISFDSYDTLDKYNLKSTQDFYYVLNKSLPKYFNSIGVENDNVLWWSNLHTNTANPHLHLCFLEKDKTRTRGKVAVKHLKGLKKFLVNELIKREKVKNNSKIIGIELLNKMKNSQKEIKKKIYNFDFTTIKKLEEFYKKLPNQGRLQYNSIHIKPYRDELNLIIKDLLENEFIKKDYEKFNLLLDELELHTNELANENISTVKENETKNLYATIGNMLLKEYKNKSNNNYEEIEKDIEDNEINDNAIETIIYESEKIESSRYKNNIYSNENLYDDEYKEGLKYLYGNKHTKKDIVKAYEILLKKSLENHVLAMQDLAKLIIKKPELNKDKLNYEKLLIDSYNIMNKFYNEKPSKFWTYKLGRFHHYDLGIDNVDYEKAKEFYLESSDYKFSKMALGNLYENGFGVEKDYEEAYRYYESVAGINPLASYKVAEFIRRKLVNNNDEIFMEKQYKIMFKYLIDKNETDGIDTQSKIILAKLLENGLGTEKNYDMAIDYYIEALNEIDVANPNVKLRLASLLSKEEVQHEFKTEENIKKLYAEAKEELIDIFEKNPTVENSLKISKLYFFAKDDDKDIDKAIEYVSKFELTNSKDLLYKASLLDKKNDYRCFNIIEKLAKENDAEANFRLGMFYLKGKYVDKDRELANEYIDKALELGSEKAYEFKNNKYVSDNKKIKNISKKLFKTGKLMKGLKSFLNSKNNELEEEIEKYLSMNKTDWRSYY